MSRVAIILIVGSIFIVTLGQFLARQVSSISNVSIPELFLALGLLYCVTKIYICWLAAPSSEKIEDENNDQENP